MKQLLGSIILFFGLLCIFMLFVLANNEKEADRPMTLDEKDREYKASEKYKAAKARRLAAYDSRWIGPRV
jgi:hypothetical protein